MDDPVSLLTASIAGLVAVGLISAAGLRAWAGWLELRRLDLSGSREGAMPARGAGRLELSELRTRVRRLEAIANGG